MLWDRGVLCVPDFVANCGGVLGGTMEFAGWRPEEIFAFCAQRFHARVTSLIRRARGTGRPLRALAEELSLARFEEVKRRMETPSLAGQFFAAGLAVYRERWLPDRLMRCVSERYFHARLS